MRIFCILLALASVATAQLNQPVATASAVVTLNVTNVVVTNWNVPNAFAGVGAKMKLMREESPARHGALNFIAANIVQTGDTWTVQMVKTNMGGRALPYHDGKTLAADLLKEPFGFSLYIYFLANGIEVTTGEIALELNGVTNRFAIPQQTIPGNQIFLTRTDSTNAHSHKAIWQHRKTK